MTSDRIEIEGQDDGSDQTSADLPTSTNESRGVSSYGPSGISPSERKKVFDSLEDYDLEDLLSYIWANAPIDDAHAYLQLVCASIEYDLKEEGLAYTTDEIEEYVPNGGLSRLPGITSICHNDKILSIGLHRAVENGEWSHKGVEVILGPVSSMLKEYGIYNISAKVVADYTSSLVSGDNVEPIKPKIDKATRQEEEGRRDRQDRPTANDPTITPGGWSTVKGVKTIAQRPYNGISVVLGGWYSLITGPPDHPRSAATKARVDLMPEDDIEALLERQPKGETVKYLSIPDSLYNQILGWRKEIKEYKPCAAILQKVLLDYKRDEEFEAECDCTGMPIPHTFVFASFGMSPSTAWNQGLNAEMLLEIYRRTIDADFEWSGWSNKDSKARIVTEHGIPQGIIALTKHSQFSPDMEDSWTYLIDGKDAGNRHNTGRLREKRRNDLNSKVGQNAIEPPESTKEIQAYLNGLDNNFFGHGGYGKLRPDKLAKASEAASTFRTEKRRDQANRKLVGMRTYSKPLYDFCGRFPRLKADAYNQLMNLSAELRHSLYGERDYELDLDKAHLACSIPVAEQAGLSVPMTKKYVKANLRDDTEFLEKGDLWWDIASMVDTDLFEDSHALRTAVKKVYSAVYGSSRGNMLYEILKQYSDLTGNWPGEGPGAIEPIMDHFAVKELFETRDKLEKIINERGGLKDATGRFIELSKWDGEKPKENRWRGVMAYVNCSYEQQIMYPIFEEAKKEMKRDGKTRFKVWLYQGDGVTINVHRDYAHEPQIARLKNAVRDRAGELNVPTRLTVDYSEK